MRVLPSWESIDWGSFEYSCTYRAHRLDVTGARRWQILLLAAGFIVLVAISALSRNFRQPGPPRRRLGCAHRRGGKPDFEGAAAGSPPRRKRRARLPAYPGRRHSWPSTKRRPPPFTPDAEKLIRFSGPPTIRFRSKTKSKGLQAGGRSRPAWPNSARAIDFARPGDRDMAGGIAMLRETGARSIPPQAHRRHLRPGCATKKTGCSKLRTASAERSQLLGLLGDHGRIRQVDRAGRAFQFSWCAARGRAPATKPKRSCATTTSTLNPPSRNAPAICARPTTRSSASPISSATTCARRWSISWASPRTRGMARYFPAHAGSAMRTAQPRQRGELPETRRGEDQRLSADFPEALGFIKSSIAKMDRLIMRSSNCPAKAAASSSRCKSIPANCSRASSPAWSIRPPRPKRKSISAAAGHRQRPAGPGTGFLEFARQCAEISQARRTRRNRESGAGPSSASG